MSAKDFFIKLRDIIFPNKLTCNYCGDEIFDGKDFCDDCFNNLPFNNDKICLCCGRQTPISTKRCFSCKGDWAIDKGRSAFAYTGIIEDIIKKFKYGNAQYLGEILAKYLVDVYVKNMFAPDIITFVPMTQESLFKRGYNQAKILAECVGDSVDVEVKELIIKRKDTPQQERLSATDRRKNLLTCFKVIDKTLVKGKNILLIDDVMTTGATSHGIATKLKKAGAKSVYLLTVASVTYQLNTYSLENEIEV